MENTENKVEELAPKLVDPNSIEADIINSVEVMYVNKAYAATCSEGVIKLYLADINDKGGIVHIEGVVMTLGVLYALQATIVETINKIHGMQQNKVVPIVPIVPRPDREPLN